MKASYDISKARAEQYGENTADGTYKEVYLNIENPFFCDDCGGWTAYEVALDLYYQGKVNNTFIEHIEAMDGAYDGDYNSYANRYMRDYLKQLGYDGIVYQNENEDTGSFSAIAFDNEQIHTVAENGILKEDNKKFSLSPTGKQATPTATNIPMRDMAYNGYNSENVKKIDTDLPYGAPVRDDIQKYQSDLPYGAPVRELTEAEKAKLLRKTGKEKKFASPDNLAPVRDDIMKSKQIASGERSDQLLNESLDNYPTKTVEDRKSVV